MWHLGASSLKSILNIYSAVLILAGVYAKKLDIEYNKNLDLKQIAIRVAKVFTDPYGVLVRYIDGLTANPEQIIIDINHKNFQKIDQFALKYYSRLFYNRQKI